MYSLPEDLVKSVTRQFQLAHSLANLNPGSNAEGVIQKRAFLTYLDEIMRKVFFPTLAQPRVTMISLSGDLLRPGKSPKGYITKLIESLELLQLRYPATDVVALLRQFESFMVYYVAYKRAHTLAGKVSRQMVDWMLCRPHEDTVFAGQLLQTLKTVAMYEHLQKVVDEVGTSPAQLQHRIFKMDGLEEIALISKRVWQKAMLEMSQGLTGQPAVAVRH